jgi:hypothetical protein
MNALATPMTTVLLSLCLLSAPAAAKEGWVELSRDLKAFQPPTGEWFIAGDARVDPQNEKRLVGTPGQGVLINGKTGRTDDLITPEKWGDVEVSLEFLIPRASNSGVKLQGLYEIQIRDSWKKTIKLTGDDCGGVYPTADRQRAPERPHYVDEGGPPRVNAAKGPGEWQTLEIIFRAPHFDKSGVKTANARFEKVVLNGKLIQENVEVAHATGGHWRKKENAVGPLMFQGTHGPVALRNIRWRPLPAASASSPPAAPPAAK